MPDLLDLSYSCHADDANRSLQPASGPVMVISARADSSWEWRHRGRRTIADERHGRGAGDGRHGGVHAVGQRVHGRLGRRRQRCREGGGQTLLEQLPAQRESKLKTVAALTERQR